MAADMYLFAFSTDGGNTYTVIPTYYQDEADFIVKQKFVNTRELKYIRLDWSRMDIKSTEKTGKKDS